MKIFYTEKAAEDLAALPKEIQKRIAEKMRFFSSQKDPLNFAEPLTDARDGDFRFRVGKYRIIFDILQGIIYVLKIRRRDKAYD